jgi:hypothetical protein
MAKFKNVFVGEGSGASKCLNTKKNDTIAPYALRTIDDSISSHSEIPPYNIIPINKSFLGMWNFFWLVCLKFPVNIIKGGDPN